MTGFRITGLTAANFQHSKVFTDSFQNMYNFTNYGFIPFITNFLGFFIVKFPIEFYVKPLDRSVPNFWDKLRQIFGKIRKTSVSEK